MHIERKQNVSSQFFSLPKHRSDQIEKQNQFLLRMFNHDSKIRGSILEFRFLSVGQSDKMIKVVVAYFEKTYLPQLVEYIREKSSRLDPTIFNDDLIKAFRETYRSALKDKSFDSSYILRTQKKLLYYLFYEKDVDFILLKKISENQHNKSSIIAKNIDALSSSKQEHFDHKQLESHNQLIKDYLSAFSHQPYRRGPNSMVGMSHTSGELLHKLAVGMFFYFLFKSTSSNENSTGLLLLLFVMTMTTYLLRKEAARRVGSLEVSMIDTATFFDIYDLLCGIAEPKEVQSIHAVPHKKVQPLRFVPCEISMYDSTRPKATTQPNEPEQKTKVIATSERKKELRPKLAVSADDKEKIKAEKIDFSNALALPSASIVYRSDSKEDSTAFPIENFRCRSGTRAFACLEPSLKKTLPPELLKKFMAQIETPKFVHHKQNQLGIRLVDNSCYMAYELKISGDPRLLAIEKRVIVGDCQHIILSFCKLTSHVDLDTDLNSLIATESRQSAAAASASPRSLSQQP